MIAREIVELWGYRGTDPAVMAVGTQRCVDPQGAGRAEGVGRNAAAVLLSPGPLAPTG